MHKSRKVCLLWKRAAGAFTLRRRSLSVAFGCAPRRMATYVDGAWAPRCADTTLGTCQPVENSVSSCRSLCSQTIGCIGFTFVRPGAARHWDDECRGGHKDRRFYHQAIHGNSTASARCCLETTLPVAPLFQGANCCVAGLLEPAELCRSNCRMPWPAPSALDSIPAAKIEAQIRQHHGTTVSMRAVPWVEIAQKVELRLRRRAVKLKLEADGEPPKRTRSTKLGGQSSVTNMSAPSDEGAMSERQSRIAVCLAGAARTFVHPAIAYGFERFVVGAAGRGTTVDVFLVLGTGEEDHRARTNFLPLDSQEYVRSSEGARHLAHAISRFAPVAVTIDPGPGNASCRTAPTGQFAKVARCVDLARAREAQLGVRYDLLFRSRPDVMWTSPVLSSGVTLGSLAAALGALPELRKVVLGTDDINLIAHRSGWDALASLRPGSLVCHRICYDQPYWRWMHGIRTHCLLKAQLASRGAHHIELQGAARPEDVLHSGRLPMAAPSLRVSFDGAAWAPHERSAFAERTLTDPTASRLPAHQLRFGSFEILRAASSAVERGFAGDGGGPPRASPFGLAVTCSANEACPAADGESEAHDARGSKPSWHCSQCTTGRWLGRADPVLHMGYCEVTEGEGDCARGSKGAWEMGGAGEQGGLLDAAACVRRCEACSRCRFVSFSPHFEDCSWFHDCSLDKLQKPHETFRTIQVRATDGLLQRSPSPSAPPYAAAIQCPTESAATWHAASAEGGATPLCARRPAVSRRRTGRNVTADGGDGASDALSLEYLSHFAFSTSLYGLIHLCCEVTLNQSIAVAQLQERAAEPADAYQQLQDAMRVASVAHRLSRAVPALRYWRAACQQKTRTGMRAAFQLLSHARSTLYVNRSVVKRRRSQAE